jgi:Putative peptidoglycan binding domain
MCNQCYRPSRVLIGELENLIDGGAPASRFAARMRPAAAPAVAANRRSASELHWGCFDGTNVRASNAVLHLLGLPQGTTPNEEDWAKAVSAYQTRKGLPSTGIIDAQTWSTMQKDLPAQKFKPLVIPVVFNGAKLGYIEKTKPYTTVPDVANKRGGATIELGFRITDPDAVRKAGFTATDGRPPFRWIQTFEISTVPTTPAMTSFVRKFTQVIDPTTILNVPQDGHPYYWDEVLPPHPQPDSADYLIDNFVNRPAANNLCYDLIFWDFPAAPNFLATPGRRFYFNVETALVGIRQGDPTRNTILDTVTWGYDLLSVKGKTEIRLNHLSPGVKGGSPTFKKILSKQIADFPHHCYASAGLSKAATCK